MKASIKGPYEESPRNNRKLATMNSGDAMSIDTTVNRSADGILLQYDSGKEEKITRLVLNAEEIDCFVFKMLCQIPTEHIPVRTEEFEFRAATPTASQQDKRHWDRVRRDFMLNRIVPLNIGNMSKIVSQNKQLILKNLDKILRASIRIETYNYQRKISIKHLVFQSVQQTGSRAQRFFKIFAESRQATRQLMDLLCITPEDLNTICSFC